MKLKKKLSLLGATFLTAASFGVAPALAQDTPAQATDDQGDEQIVVVGSRLRRDNFNTPAPIELITREESVRAGFTTTTEILQSNTATGGTAQLNNNFSGLVTDGGPGANTLGLRGFGPTSTLILLNGRRLTPAGTRGSVGAADLNTIPSAIVDRIEILKDGASSIYGSDAVAGVVNIITRQNMEETVLEGQLNMNESGGGEQIRMSASAGHTWGNFSLSGSLDYYEREAVLVGERDWAACPRDVYTQAGYDTLGPLGFIDHDINTGEEECWTANFANSGGSTINTIGTSTRSGLGGPGTGATAPHNFNRWRPNSFISGIAGLDGFEGVSNCGDPDGVGPLTACQNPGFTGLNNRDTFDPLMLQEHLFNATRNMNAFVQGTYDLGNHEIYGEVLFSRRDSDAPLYRQLTLDYPSTGLPGVNPLLPPELRVGAVQNPNSTVPSPAPTGVPGTLMPSAYQTQVRAFIGFGLTDFSQEVEYTRVVGGIRGDFLFPDWRYDFNMYHGSNDSSYSSETFLTDHVFNSMAITTVIPGGTPANLIRQTPDGVSYICSITATNPAYGCIPAPALTTDTIAGRLPQDFKDWILDDATGTTTYEETSFQFVIDGPLFTLPAGEVLAAFGAEYRTAEIDDTPNQNALDNNFLGLTSGGATRGEDSVQEFFGEVEVPILAGMPLAESLTANLSGRYTDYDSYGADETYKIGLTWSPVENLLFRATTGTSYRAPALFEQFLGPTTGFQGANFDPCDDYGSGNPLSTLYQNCDAEINDNTFQQLNGVTIVGGGGAAQGLAAEHSDNLTYGFTWRPLNDVDGLGSLAIAIDRFSIEVNDQVAQFGAANLLTLCYESVNFPADPYCAFRARDAGNRLTVFNNYTNIASQVSEGYDYDLRYLHSLMGGTLTLDLSLTQFLDQKTRLFDVDPVSGDPVDFTDFNGQTGAPEMSGDFYAEFEQGPWTVRYGVTWIDEMSNYAAQEEDPGTSFYVLSTPQIWIQGASVQYRQDDWEFTAGVRNLTDEQPPEYSAIDNLVNRIGNTVLFSGYEQLYYGRQFFVNVTKSF